MVSLLWGPPSSHQELKGSPWCRCCKGMLSFLYPLSPSHCSCYGAACLYRVPLLFPWCRGFFVWLPLVIVRGGAVAGSPPTAAAAVAPFKFGCLYVCVVLSAQAFPLPPSSLSPSSNPLCATRTRRQAAKSRCDDGGVRRDDHNFLFHSSLVRGASWRPADSNRSDPRPRCHHALCLWCLPASVIPGCPRKVLFYVLLCLLLIDGLFHGPFLARSLLVTSTTPTRVCSSLSPPSVRSSRQAAHLLRDEQQSRTGFLPAFPSCIKTLNLHVCRSCLVLLDEQMRLRDLEYANWKHVRCYIFDFMYDDTEDSPQTRCHGSQQEGSRGTGTVIKRAQTRPADVVHRPAWERTVARNPKRRESGDARTPGSRHNSVGCVSSTAYLATSLSCLALFSKMIAET